MNPLLREAANSIPGGGLLGVMTVVFFATFLYWCWYAYAPSHREKMEDLGRMPFENDIGPHGEGGEQ